jgi:hypothetical protein
MGSVGNPAGVGPFPAITVQFSDSAVNVEGMKVMSGAF